MNATTNLPPKLELKINLTDKQFWQLCHDNGEFQFERTAQGEVIIMPPTGGNTSRRNIKIATQLENWSRQNNLGETFDSNGGFKLPNGANRSPDACWVKRDRWEALTPEQQEDFVPLCPDFVVELRSPSDALKTLQDKMQEYIDNGAKLAWLIDPKREVVEIYRPNQEVEVLESPNSVSGEDVLPGFVLDLAQIMS
ncbi:MAG: hypothetical protein BRC34_00580 [Cyanobacteria bacterium QH_1_48_107]|jgi:Uma2 family endonuclease|nr:MAG: hypothetical protein BRC34_00580 [Cyanobacteria bacterium QH_1_48_107]